MSHYEKVRQIVAKELDIFIDLVVPEAFFYADLGAVSMEDVEIVIACEEEFHISISDEDAAQIETVGQLVTYINRKTRPDDTIWPPPPSIPV